MMAWASKWGRPGASIAEVQVTEPLLLTVRQAAELLNLSRSVVYQLIGTGELPSLTIGACRRIPAEALRRWVSERTEAQGQGYAPAGPSPRA